MNEVKGLLFYMLSKLTIIIALIMVFFGIGYERSILLMIIAGMEALFGFLYWFGIIDKIRRRKQ